MLLFRNKRLINYKSLLNNMPCLRFSELLDQMQIDQLKEQIILVNDIDEVQGCITKEKAHSAVYINSTEALPHRAFSLFLFNSKNELCMPKRYPYKITFPLLWTNSCCSHPRFNDEEMDIANNIGIKKSCFKKSGS